MISTICRKIAPEGEGEGEGDRQKQWSSHYYFWYKLGELEWKQKALHNEK